MSQLLSEMVTNAGVNSGRVATARRRDARSVGTGAVRAAGRVLAALTVLVCLVSTTLTAPALAKDDDRPDVDVAKEFIRDLADRAIGVLKDEDATRAQRLRVFKTLLTEGFDLPFLARLALGRYRRDATPDQLAEYDKLFANFVLNKYASILGSYSGERVVVTAARTAGRRDVYVTTEISSGGGGARVDWRVRKYDDGLKVIDVVVENISMVISQREEFASVISREGFDGLLERLREQEDQIVEAMRG